MSASEPSKGLRTFGPFTLLEKVGMGGMGAVFKARRGQDEIVALKVASRRRQGMFMGRGMFEGGRLKGRRAGRPAAGRRSRSSGNYAHYSTPEIGD